MIHDTTNDDMKRYTIYKLNGQIDRTLKSKHIFITIECMTT